jgi:FAD/FMN-containing dehydrogenase
VSETVVPRSFSEAAAVLAGAVAQMRAVRVVGGGTKLGWGGATQPHALRLLTTHLDRVVVHDDGVIATLNAGTPLVRAQAVLGRSGLMLAVDPHLGLGQRPAATVGGVIATGDSGPLSHRFGTVADQIAGITAALSDGTVVRTGPLSGQEQDGYNLAKLLTGSFGTLGVILAVDVHVRLLPGGTATALGTSDDAGLLRDAVEVVTARHDDLEAFDVAWIGGHGGLLALLGGDESNARAAVVAETMRACGLGGTTVRVDDAELWARQRAGQRSAARAVLRVHARRRELDVVLNLADEVGATLVGRAARGVAYLTLDVGRIAAARAGLPAGSAAVALDLPAGARGAIDPWNVGEGAELEMMRGLKARFDPAGVCNPGVFAGGI